MKIAFQYNCLSVYSGKMFQYQSLLSCFLLWRFFFFNLLNCIKVVLHLSLLDKFKTQCCRKLIQSYPMPSSRIDNGKYTSKFCWTICVVFLVVKTAISVTPRVSCYTRSSLVSSKLLSRRLVSSLLENCKMAIAIAYNEQSSTLEG